MDTRPPYSLYKVWLLTPRPEAISASFEKPNVIPSLYPDYKSQSDVYSIYLVLCFQRPISFRFFKIFQNQRTISSCSLENIRMKQPTTVLVTLKTLKNLRVSWNNRWRARGFSDWLFDFSKFLELWLYEKVGFLICWKLWFWILRTALITIGVCSCF